MCFYQLSKTYMRQNLAGAPEYCNKLIVIELETSLVGRNIYEVILICLCTAFENKFRSRPV